MKIINRIWHRSMIDDGRLKDISSKQDKAHSAAPNLSSDIIAPDSSKNPWNVISLGAKPNGEEIVNDFSVNPNIVAVGEPGAGKSITKFIAIDHCINHVESWEVLILSMSNDGEFIDIARKNNHIVNLSTKKIEIGNKIRNLHALYKERMSGIDSPFDKSVLAVIPNLSYFTVPMLDASYYDRAAHFSYESASLIDGKETLHLLDELFTLGGEAGIHFMVEENYLDSFSPTMKRSIDSGTSKTLGFGQEFFKKYPEQKGMHGKGVGLEASNGNTTFFKSYLLPCHFEGRYS